MRATLTRWPGAEPPTSAALRESLRREPRSFSTWSNGPGDTYAAHAHSYDKLLVCLRGSVTFTLPGTGERLDMRPGDRLFLPAQTTHGAIVGPAGVECAEAHLTPE
ncbi:MAG TPA: cupin domain-containing protein [Ktedonobacterales bacterium]